MKELFKAREIFESTKKECLEKKVDDLEAYINERYSSLEKLAGIEFVLENVRFNASIAAYMERVHLRKNISKKRFMDFLGSKRPTYDKIIFEKLGRELKAAGISLTTREFVNFLMRVDGRIESRPKKTGTRPRTIRIKKKKSRRKK